MTFPLSSKRCQEVAWPPGWVMSFPPFTLPQQLLPSPEHFWWCTLHVPALLPSFLISSLSLIWAPWAHFHQDAAGLFSIHPWGKQRSPQKHDLPREVSARDEAISSIHTLLSVSALQLTNICDTLCCSQPSLSPGIVKDPLDVSQFISATNRHKTDKLLARVREMWQRDFVEKHLVTLNWEN